MHNGPSTQTPATATSCCGARCQVVALTRDDTAGCLVELIRCAPCGASTWRVDGVLVERRQALAALSTVFTSRASSRPAVRRAPARAVSPDRDRRDLGALLEGWQVLGARG